MIELSNKIEIGKSQKLYEEAKTKIAGGTQLLSKRPEMFLPDVWPAYYDKAEGCEVVDLDGNRYYDFAYMGVGANVLGYCDSDVDDAVIAAVRKCTNTTLNAPEEMELANLMLEMHPWADMVRYTKTGGEAMAVAVRLARASTGKEKVLFCGYHGWHDWYLSSNLAEDKLGDGHLIPGLEPKGVPRVLLNTAIPFKYNDTETFLQYLDEYGEDLSCVVVESIRNFEPAPGFFATIREETKKRGIVLILDEITAGFRLSVGGAHLREDLNFGIVPDIAVYGKAVSNGYPMAIVVGQQWVMDAAQESFISSLCWTDRLGLAAALATIRKMQKIDSPSRIKKIGEQIYQGWTDLAERHELPIKITGTPAILAMSLPFENALAFKTLLTQEMLKRGYLATTAMYMSCAHEGFVEGYLAALDEVFGMITELVRTGQNPEDLLQGKVCHAGFKRLT